MCPGPFETNAQTDRSTHKIEGIGRNSARGAAAARADPPKSKTHTRPIRPRTSSVENENPRTTAKGGWRASSSLAHFSPSFRAAPLLLSFVLRRLKKRRRRSVLEHTPAGPVPVPSEQGEAHGRRASLPIDRSIESIDSFFFFQFSWACRPFRPPLRPPNTSSDKCRRLLVHSQSGHHAGCASRQRLYSSCSASS